MEAKARTVNGKSFMQIMAELRAPFGDGEVIYKEQIDTTYLATKAVVKRLDEVLGLNYSVEYSECTSDLLPDVGGEVTPFIRLSCTIIVLDDNGGEVCRRSAWSGDRVTRVAKGDREGSIVNYGNDLDGLCSDALKRAARRLGVTDARVGKGNRLNGAKKATTSSQNGAADRVRIVFLSEFTQKGSTGYSCRVKTAEGENELVVWNNSAQPMIERMGNQWYAAAFSGKQGDILAKRTEYQGRPQLVFVGFPQ